MKGPEMRHPENEQLLRYADGELPARTAGKIRSHVGACWQCRVELEELEETISECVRYRKNILQPFLPSPPAPWFDIYQGFAKIDASSEPDFFYRATQRFGYFPNNGLRITYITWIQWKMRPRLWMVMTGVGMSRPNR